MLTVLLDIHTQFIFDIGTYETIQVDLEFKDGSTQSVSTFEANRRIADLMQKKGMLIHKSEFIGGHNYDENLFAGRGGHRGAGYLLALIGYFAYPDMQSSQ